MSGLVQDDDLSALSVCLKDTTAVEADLKLAITAFEKRFFIDGLQ